MGSTVLAYAIKLLIVPAIVLGVKLCRQGWHAMATRLAENLKDTAIASLVVGLFVYGWNLYSVIKQINTAVVNIRVPYVEVPPLPSKWDARQIAEESHAYPWISWTKYSGPSESGLEIFVTVGAYPDLGNDSARPYLPRIHERVGVPMFVNQKQDGWWSCLIYDEDVPWIRAGDEFNKPTQTVSWGPSHNIEVEAIIKDDNGNWLLRAVIHEPGDSWEETAVGRINRQGKLVPLTVHQVDDHEREFKEKVGSYGSGSFTKAELIALSTPIHESTGTEMNIACKGRRYSYEVNFNKPGRSVTLDHNFGK